MATLARADVDPVDLPHLHLENEPSHVSARPSREFSAYADATLDLGPPPRAPWLGKTLFISTMVGIIAAASVTAVRENAQQPWLAPWLYSASQAAASLDQRLSVWLGDRAAPTMASSELDTEPSAQAVAASATPSSHDTRAAAALAGTNEAPGERVGAQPEHAALLPGLVEPNERVRLPEVVFVNPEPQEHKPAAQAPRGHKLKGRAAKLQARAKHARKVSAPVASAAAPSSGNWEQARESARAAYAAGRYRDALVAYEQAARLNPRHGLTLAGLGAARMQTGDAAGAVDAYRRAAATAPTNLTFQIALARAYERQGDDARARETYQRVLRLDRNNVAAQSGLDRL
jgi:tetratricopeptide (TPR) repeat protein